MFWFPFTPVVFLVFGLFRIDFAFATYLAKVPVLSSSVGVNKSSCDGSTASTSNYFMFWMLLIWSEEPRNPSRALCPRRFDTKIGSLFRLGLVWRPSYGLRSFISSLGGDVFCSTDLAEKAALSISVVLLSSRIELLCMRKASLGSLPLNKMASVWSTMWIRGEPVSCCYIISICFCWVNVFSIGDSMLFVFILRLLSRSGVR